MKRLVSGRMMDGEAMAEWAIEEQTKRTQKEMKNQVRAKEIEKAIGETLARVGQEQRGEGKWLSTANRCREG
jgi:hypothetical protein